MTEGPGARSTRQKTRIGRTSIVLTGSLIWACAASNPYGGNDTLRFGRLAD